MKSVFFFSLISSFSRNVKICKTFQAVHSFAIARLYSNLASLPRKYRNTQAFSTNQSLRPERENLYGIDFFYNDVYEVPLPDKHRFPMEKYRFVRQTLQKEMLSTSQPPPIPVRFFVSPLATRPELVTTHCPGYIDRYCTGKNMTAQEIRKTGFPWSQAQVNRSLSSTGGTIAAMRNVMEKQKQLLLLQSKVLNHHKNPVLCSGHIAGGTHHAFYDYGEGFCIFNDIAVACNVALQEYPNLISRILIIDCDVHQGNGNAKFFAGSSQVYTYSIHCKENLFSTKQFSSLDIEVAQGCSDDDYLKILVQSLSPFFRQIQPQLVFLQMGVDISEDDRLGKLKITRRGLQQRNRFLYELLVQARIPAVITMGGGYPKDLDPTSNAFRAIVEYHADVYRQAVEIYSKS